MKTRGKSCKEWDENKGKSCKEWDENKGKILQGMWLKQGENLARNIM